MTIEKNDKIIQFDHLPMPITSNHQYVSFQNSHGKVMHASSSGLKDFKKKMQEYYYQHLSEIMTAQSIIRDWKRESKHLQVSAIFYYPKERLFNLKGEPKKLDVSNRLKALHDCLADFLLIDDSLFFKIEAEKKVGPVEKVRIEIGAFSRDRT